MDDRTFIASYAAREAERINQRLKQALARATPPTTEEKDALIKDIEETLSRLQRAFTQLGAESGEE